MKHFVKYTVLRIALFLACWAVFAWAAGLIFGTGNMVGIWALVVAAVVSSVLSLKLLEGPREQFAQSVEARAERAAARLEEMKSAEDTD